MASEDKLTNSQVIKSTLVTVGYPTTLDTDLNFAADVVDRAVNSYRAKEAQLNATMISEKTKLKAIMVLNSMYTLEERQKRAKERQEQQQRKTSGDFLDTLL